MSTNEVGDQSPLQSRRRRYALIAVVIGLCAVVAILFWLLRGVGKDRDAQATPLATTAVAGSTARLDAQRTPPNTLSRSSASGKDGSLAEIVALLKQEKIVICGLSFFETVALFVSGIDASNTATNAVIGEAAGKLMRSDQPREQALGLYVQARLAGMDATSIITRCIGDADKDCFTKTYVGQSQQRAAASEPLVKLAEASRDPGIYAAALYACGGDHSGTCGSISYAAWARMEPNNAAAWMLTAYAADDDAERNAALERAVAASGYDLHAPALVSLLNIDTFKSQSPVSQHQIGNALLGMNLASNASPTWALSKLCKRSDVSDEARKATCATLANRLLAHDEGVDALSEMASIGKRLGLGEVKLRALQDESALLSGLRWDVISKPAKDLFSCEAFASGKQYTELLLANGERAAGRDFVSRSGKTLSELANQYRKKYPGWIP